MAFNAQHRDGEQKAMRMVLFLTMVFLTFLWGFFAYWAITSRQETISAAERGLSHMTHAAESHVHNLLKMAEIFQVTTERWLEENSSHDPRTDAGFAALIKDYRHRTGGLIDIRMATSSGDLYYFPNDSAKPVDNVADREYFQAVIKAPPGLRHTGIPVVSRVSGQWRLPITMRMEHTHHGFAVINASVNLSELISTFESERPKPNGTITLWRTDGALLLRTPQIEALVGKPVAKDWNDRGLITPQPGGSFLSRQTPIDGTARLVSYKHLKDLPLLVVVSEPLDDTLEPWFLQMYMALGALLLVTAWGILFSARLVGALRVLDRNTQELERLSITDSLTGLYNRRHLFETGMREMARTRRYSNPVSLMMIDVDHFKAINDTWGHPTGDRVLQELAQVMKSIVRDQDSAGRLGGEEFAVILPETDPQGAGIIAERLRAAVQESAMVTVDDGSSVNVTVSIGIATSTPDNDSFEAVMSHADKGLYLAKDGGRNRVMAG
jgi:diguanylate cyclase (GGDEF)-like protein